MEIGEERQNCKVINSNKSFSKVLEYQKLKNFPLGIKHGGATNH